MLLVCLPGFLPAQITVTVVTTGGRRFENLPLKSLSDSGAVVVMGGRDVSVGERMVSAVEFNGKSYSGFKDEAFRAAIGLQSAPDSSAPQTAAIPGQMSAALRMKRGGGRIIGAGVAGIAGSALTLVASMVTKSPAVIAFCGLATAGTAVGLLVSGGSDIRKAGQMIEDERAISAPR